MFELYIGVISFLFVFVSFSIACGVMGAAEIEPKKRV
jgi:hypothetical protein